MRGPKANVGLRGQEAPMELMACHWSIPSTPRSAVLPAKPRMVLNQSVMWKRQPLDCPARPESKRGEYTKEGTRMPPSHHVFCWQMNIDGYFAATGCVNSTFSLSK